MKKFVLILSLLLFVSVNSPAQVVVYTETALNAWSYLGHSATFAYTGWSCTNTFNSTEQVHSGSTATKVVAGAWAGYKIRTRTYGDTIWLPIAGLDSIKFYIYPLTTGYNYAVKFADEITGHTFTTVTTGTLSADSWHLVHFAISQLNTNAYDSLVAFSIEPQTGTANTFYVDDIEFTSSTPPAGPALPYNLSSYDQTNLGDYETWNSGNIYNFSSIDGGSAPQTYVPPADGSPTDIIAYITGYGQGYNDTGWMQSDSIDYTSFQIGIHFSVIPDTAGGLNFTSNSLTPYNINALMTNKPAEMPMLVCVGGAGSRTNFNHVVDYHLNKFIDSVANFVNTYGYDGVDIDWESLWDADTTNHHILIDSLRSKLDSLETLNSKTYYLTVAVGLHPDPIAREISKLDWINVMCYDLATGAYSGWVVWHNSPASNGGQVFPSTGQPIPANDYYVYKFHEAGIDYNKITIGADFYGYRWYGGHNMTQGGATTPMDYWGSQANAPSVAYQSPNWTLLPAYYDSTAVRWDSLCHATYLTFNDSTDANDMFISIESEESVTYKVNYCRETGIKGMILWDLTGGHFRPKWKGKSDPYMDAIKAANQ